VFVKCTYWEDTSESEKIIGTIGLIPKNPKLPNQYELGFVLGETRWGKGYAYEAATALISFTNKNYKIEKILAYCATQNIFSFKLLEKIGMQREGIIKKHLLKNGNYFDSYIYTLINEK
jgi:RimJ/RimL family protein N-acetyltransferase